MPGVTLLWQSWQSCFDWEPCEKPFDRPKKEKKTTAKKITGFLEFL
jgi:hypothetical protein